MTAVTRSILRLVVLGAIVALSTPLAGRVSVEWPRFGGPNGSGVAEREKPPITFGPSENLLWKTPVPCRGHTGCAGSQRSTGQHHGHASNR